MDYAETKEKKLKERRYKHKKTKKKVGVIDN